MIYAIIEIIAFLCIATFLGFFLGWLMRGLSAAKRAERQWRRVVDEERAKAERVESELKRYRGENEELRSQIRTLESRLEESGSEEERTAPPAVPPVAAQEDSSGGKIAEIAQRNRGDEQIDDDLKRIRGIGPVLEGLLKEKGIRSYRQVALLNQDDIEHVADAIGSFPGRIERDNWTESAREQHRLKYGTEP